MKLEKNLNKILLVTRYLRYLKLQLTNTKLALDGFTSMLMVRSPVLLKFYVVYMS